MKNLIFLLIMSCCFAMNAGTTGAAEVQTFPAGQNAPSLSEGTKQTATIGPRDTEKEKGHGVGMDIFLNEYLAITNSISLLPSEQSQLPWQKGNNGGLDLNSSKIGGTFGLKMLFK